MSNNNNNKRKADGNGAKNKKCKNQYLHSDNSIITTTKGHSCIVATSDQGKERQSKAEILNWIENHINNNKQLYDFARDSGNKDNDPSDNASAIASAVSNSLEAELASLQQNQGRSAKNENSEFVWLPYDVQLRGVNILVIRNPQLNVYQLINNLFKELLSTKQFHTRYSIRLEPVERFSYSKFDEFIATGKPIVDKYFADRINAKNSSEKESYAVVFDRRGENTQMKRMKIIDAIASLVPTDHFKVNLTDPQHIILVQQILKITGIAVFPSNQYKLSEKNNIRTIYDKLNPSAAKPQESGSDEELEEKKEEKQSD
jgi:hypothetical protein